MKRFLWVLCILGIVCVVGIVAPALGVPDLEQDLTASGGWRFAGPLGSDDGPDLLEAISYGDGALIWLIDSSPLYLATPGPVIRWPAGTAPPWGKEGGWPDPAAPPIWSAAVGNAWYTLAQDIPRPFDVRGTGADSAEVVFLGTTTKVVLSCTKKR